MEIHVITEDKDVLKAETLSHEIRHSAEDFFR
jgi:hypothetical protein